MSNLMSGGAITRTSAFSGLKRRLIVRKAGMAASFSTGTSVGERGNRLARLGVKQVEMNDEQGPGYAAVRTSSPPPPTAGGLGSCGTPCVRGHQGHLG